MDGLCDSEDSGTDGEITVYHRLQRIYGKSNSVSELLETGVDYLSR